MCARDEIKTVRRNRRTRQKFHSGVFLTPRDRHKWNSKKEAPQVEQQRYRGVGNKRSGFAKIELGELSVRRKNVEYIREHSAIQACGYIRERRNAETARRNADFDDRYGYA